MADDDIKTEDEALNPKNRGLGRGLNALFEDEESAFQEAGIVPASEDGGASSDSGEIDTAERSKRQTLGVEQIEPNVSQPRQNFDQEALQELSDSIKVHGVLQPILVRTIEVDGEDDPRYEIVAGERRWRASQLAQLHEVPVIVLELTDEEAFQIALIENLQRRDLDPIEEAIGYRKMTDLYGYTQDKLADVIGKSRSHIANTLRLLNLPDDLHKYIRSGELSAGHARTLITADDPAALAKEIMDGQYSVREAEKRASEIAGRDQKADVNDSVEASGRSSKIVQVYQKDADTLALEQEVSNSLGMAVTIDTKDGATGNLRIAFKDLDQLDDLLHRLSSLPAQKLMG